MNASANQTPATQRSHLVERGVESLAIAQSPLEARRAEPLETDIAAAIDPPSAPAAASRPMARSEQAALIGPVSRQALVGAGLVIGTAAGARSRLGEQFSVIQHPVLKAVRSTPSIDGRCDRIIMITSARPAEGKSFTALNLAAAMAQFSQRSVVLIDADGKPGSLTDLLGLRDAVGLCCLANEPSSGGAAPLVPTAVPRLFILPFGRSGCPGKSPPPATGSALLRLANAYPDHLFVLDTPPCLATSDASLLAPVVGQVVMVVQAQSTQRSEVEAALDLVDNCPTLQLLLSRALLLGNDAFGAYGYYAYTAPTPDRP